MYSLLLMGLAGILIGGAYTFISKSARWIPISFIFLAVMSLVAAYLFTQ
ncbi:hypothetical protein [Arthrobacter polaris]|nr:hypothetical protein [Arthrobacter polaris]UIK89569.1 hypothetical protein J0916_03880 [Arthrobacter polaris]